MVLPNLFTDPLRPRPATEADAALLMAWRNDPETLQWSVVAQPVAERQHLEWLRCVLADPTRRLRVVEYEDRPHPDYLPPPESPVGTYRLDFVGTDTVEVSLTVAPEWRGRGLATYVIRRASAEAVSLGASSVLARVHAGNVRSLRAFERAGFSRDGFAAGAFQIYAVGWREVAAQACALCRAGAPHHTNAAGSIGGADRREVWDIHAVEDSSGVGLRECDAGDLLLQRAAAREQMRGGAGTARDATRLSERGRSTRPASTTCPACLSAFPVAVRGGKMVHLDKDGAVHSACAKEKVVH